MRTIAVLWLAFAMCLHGKHAAAQETVDHWDHPDVEAFIGVLEWNVDDATVFRNLGFYGGVRGRFPIAYGLAFTGTLGFATVNRIDAEGIRSHDEHLILPLPGIEYGVAWHRTEISVGLSGGAALRKSDLPDVEQDDFAPYIVIAPKIAVEHRLRDDLAVRLQLDDFWLTEIGTHNPALTLGLSLGV